MVAICRSRTPSRKVTVPLTSEVNDRMSGVESEADAARDARNFCFVPKGDMPWIRGPQP